MKDKIKNLTDFLNELDTEERTGYGRFIKHDIIPEEDVLDRDL